MTPSPFRARRRRLVDGLRGTRGRILLIAVATGVAVAGAFAVVFLTGLAMPTSSAYPPCDELPAMAQVREALEEHAELARQLRDLGSDVVVGAAAPCLADDDAALVEISYGDAARRGEIDRALAAGDGFGVPVHVVAR